MSKSIRVATFKSSDGKTIEEASMKRTITKDGVVYIRQKKKSYTRASRASEQADAWRHIASDLESIKEEIEELGDVPEEGEGELQTKRDELISQAQSSLDEVDFGELESLTEEMVSWRDNLQGTSLENTSKYEEVSEAADTLEGIDPNMNASIDSVEDIDTAIDELNEKADELENVSFPGMY